MSPALSGRVRQKFARSFLSLWIGRLLALLLRQEHLVVGTETPCKLQARKLVVGPTRQFRPPTPSRFGRANGEEARDRHRVGDKT